MEIKIENVFDLNKAKLQLDMVLPIVEKGKPYTVEIKPFKEKRSLDANAYLHILLRAIGEKLTCPMEEVKFQMNTEYGTPAADAQGTPIVIRLPETADIADFYPYYKNIGCVEMRDSREKSGFITFNEYLLFKQTHTLNTAEMAVLLDGVVSEAQLLGIETRTPAELALLKAKWEARKVE